MANVIAYVVYFVYTYWAAIQIVIAVAATAYTLKSQRDQQRAIARAELESQQRNSYRNFRQPLTSRRRIYGTYRVGGPFLFLHNVHTFDAHMIIALAGHQIQEITHIYIFKRTCDIIDSVKGKTEGKYRKNIAVFAYLGTDDQNVGTVMRTFRFWENDSSYAIPNVISETDRFAGIACIHAFSNDFSVDWEGDAPEFSALIKGHNKVLDPRTGLTGWSQNPALIAAHYLMDAMKFPAESIDWDTVIAAANTCDEFVFVKGGGLIRRYTLNGVITDDETFENALNDIERTMGGKIRYSSGTWLITAGAPYSIHPTTLLETEFLGDYTVDLDRPARSLPNAVRGNFIDAGTWVASSFGTYEDVEAAEADGGQTNWLDVDYPLVTDYRQAQRLARIELARARARITLSVTMSLKGMIYRVGDVIKLTLPEIGFEDELFLIDAWTLAPQDSPSGEGTPMLGIRLDLISYDPSMFDWNPETDEQELVVGQVNIDNISGPSNSTETDIITTPSFSTTLSATWTIEQEVLDSAGIFGGWKQRVKGAIDLSLINTTTGDITTTTLTINTLLNYDVTTWTQTITSTYPAGYTYMTHVITSLTVEHYNGSGTGADPIGNLTDLLS